MRRKQILCPIELADHFPFLAFLQILFIWQESIVSYLEPSSRFCLVSNKTSKIARFEKFYNRQLIKYEIADWTPLSSKIEEKELHKSWRSLSTLFWFSPFPFSIGKRSFSAIFPRKSIFDHFCHCLPGYLVDNDGKHAEIYSLHCLPIWLLSALYIMVKRERPCTTPCLFKAHLPTAHSPGLNQISTRIQPSLPCLCCFDPRNPRLCSTT